MSERYLSASPDARSRAVPRRLQPAASRDWPHESEPLGRLVQAVGGVASVVREGEDAGDEAVEAAHGQVGRLDCDRRVVGEVDREQDYIARRVLGGCGHRLSGWGRKGS